MKTRYRLTRRGIRGNKFYCVDTTTGKRTSLGTTNEDEARQIVEARNNSERQPVLNLQIAKAYPAWSVAELRRVLQPVTRSPVELAELQPESGVRMTHC
jgi:hypothetical protein